MKAAVMESAVVEPTVKTTASPSPPAETGAARAKDSTATSAKLRIFFMTVPPVVSLRRKWSACESRISRRPP